MNNKIITYPEPKIIENNANNIIGSDDDELITEAESPYYAEFHEEIHEEISGNEREFFIFSRENDIRIINGWCENEEDIKNIKFIVDAMNEKVINDNLATVNENWIKNRKWSNSNIRSCLYAQFEKDTYTEHGD